MTVVTSLIIVRLSDSVDEDFDTDDHTEEDNFEYIEDSDGDDDTISFFTAAPAA